MKKIVLSVLALTISMASFAQLSFSVVDPVKYGPAIGEDDLTGEVIIHSRIKNLGDSGAFTWISTAETPNGWGVMICDNILCHDSLTTTAEFTLDTSEEGTMDVHFKPNAFDGTGVVKIKVYRNSNPDDSIVNTYTLNAWGATVKKVKTNNNLTVYPNPAKEVITVNFETRTPVDVVIYNVLGSEVLRKSHIGEESRIDISNLENGVYFVRFIGEDGKTYSKSFKKIN